jgi:hypothetical protein
MQMCNERFRNYLPFIAQHPNWPSHQTNKLFFYRICQGSFKLNFTDINKKRMPDAKSDAIWQERSAHDEDVRITIISSPMAKSCNNLRPKNSSDI